MNPFLGMVENDQDHVQVTDEHVINVMLLSYSYLSAVAVVAVALGVEARAVLAVPPRRVHAVI